MKSLLCLEIPSSSDNFLTDCLKVSLPSRLLEVRSNILLRCKKYKKNLNLTMTLCFLYNVKAFDFSTCTTFSLKADMKSNIQRETVVMLFFDLTFIDNGLLTTCRCMSYVISFALTYWSCKEYEANEN